VDLLSALSALPEAHATAIALRLAGATPTDVAAELGIEPPAVEPLLVIAEAKLKELLGGPTSGCASIPRLPHA
jgi:hypothetical protein